MEKKKKNKQRGKKKMESSLSGNYSNELVELTSWTEENHMCSGFHWGNSWVNTVGHFASDATDLTTVGFRLPCKDGLLWVRPLRTELGFV
jgi:hypothetical protein